MPADRKYQEKPPLPFVAGAEVSGVVLEVGEKVRSFPSLPGARPLPSPSRRLTRCRAAAPPTPLPQVKGLAPGDCVAAFLPQMGGFADEVVADSASVIKLGQGTDVAAAAGLPIAYGTSHVALLHRCRLRAGQTVLVLGAAGGVGLAAVQARRRRTVTARSPSPSRAPLRLPGPPASAPPAPSFRQIAKAVGARVVAVARGAQKLAALRAAGADVCVDSSALGKGGLKAALEGEGVKGGVDVVYDPVGGKLSADSLRVVKWGGQVAVRSAAQTPPAWFLLGDAGDARRPLHPPLRPPVGTANAPVLRARAAALNR